MKIKMVGVISSTIVLICGITDSVVLGIMGQP
jgi:hypothetical protein